MWFIIQENELIEGKDFCPFIFPLFYPQGLQ